MIKLLLVRSRISMIFAASLMLGLGAKKAEGQSEREGQLRMASFGQVEVIDAVRRLPTGERIGIRAYESIYKALGVTNDKFVAWEERYGFDSLGVGDNGSILAPGFPVFSKVAWMYVDPIDLTASETKDLVVECEDAMSNTEDVPAKDELRRIRDLALTAINKSATLRFGHP